jgi:elongation factor P
MILVEERAVALELPPAVTLTVAECAPPMKGQEVQKDARLETGLTIKVPPFLKPGERVRVSTETLEYLGKG